MYLQRIVASAKGFGSSPQHEPEKIPITTSRDGRLSKKASKEKAIQQALEISDKSKGSQKTGIDSQNGRVDYIKVQDWGTGEPDDLGNLKLASAPKKLTFTAPFYEQLARHLESLQSDGSLAIAQPASSKPIPPFHKWAFAEQHYIQYLTDMLKVHMALEKACKSSIHSVSNSEYLDEDTRQHALQILETIGIHDALARSPYIAIDIRNINEASITKNRNNGVGGVDGGSNTRIEVAPNAQACAHILDQLAVHSQRAESAEEMIPILLRLVAHGYVLLLTLLTSGGRIGSLAAEKLNLFQKDALHLYKSYPDRVDQPLLEFRRGVDVLGEELDEVEKEIFMDELPNAFRRASMLLESLARE